MKIERIISGSLQSNGYIVYEKESCFIIDPGYNAPMFEKAMSKAGLKCIGVLLTHNHYDHVGAVAKLKVDTGATVYMHASDAESFKGVDEVLYGGEVLEIEGVKLEVIHTPGHSAGSVCFAEFNAGAIFTGDTIFDVDLGRSDLATGSEAELVRSIRDTVDKWSNDITIYPGHGSSVTMKWVRGHNREFNDIVSKGRR